VAGSVRDCAVLIAIDIQPRGHRSVLGVSVSLSEAEVYSREFLSSLKKRSMHGVKLIVSDAHEGLKAARQATFAGVPWQRCQFHLAQNAMHHTPKLEMRKQVADDIRNAFQCLRRSSRGRRARPVCRPLSRDGTETGRVGGSQPRRTPGSLRHS
ncbi:transposase, partial [Rhodopirellula sp.]|nr:transposase [Rhodopirellula sp.]